jgi:hypothetical protein
MLIGGTSRNGNLYTLKMLGSAATQKSAQVLGLNSTFPISKAYLPKRKLLRGSAVLDDEQQSSYRGIDGGRVLLSLCCSPLPNEAEASEINLGHR